MIRRPSLLLLTAGAAGLAALANGLSAAAAPASSAESATRLGAAIGTDLASRDLKSAQRGRQLDLREQAARSAEQRLQVAAAALSKAQPASAGATPSGASGTGAVPADPQAERWDELARIYQAMKPKAAAGVFEQLSMDVQVAVAQRMRERATAAILAAMTPKGAAVLTMAMAKQPPASGG